MSYVINKLDAVEILDSRGRPTLKVFCELEGGTAASASVPSGASTGRAEALELRDRDDTRYGGYGCLKAVNNVVGAIQDAVQGKRLDSQAQLDAFLIELDGTENKSSLGANAILGVSLAFARACSVMQNKPLYQYFSEMAGHTMPTLPQLTVNLFSGGKHAGGQVSIQDVLVAPLRAATVSESLAMTYRVYQAAAKLTEKKYGMRLLTADEGGLAPPFPDDETMLSDAVQAIIDAGYVPGEDIALAIDVASSHFYRDELYHISGNQFTGPEMVDYLVNWMAEYPIISVEDGLAEEDWEHWQHLINKSSSSVLILGDDLLCTNPDRIQKAVDLRAANALLLKVNQIGTLTEALQSMRLAREANWQVVVSARSGETEDNWLADLAVGWGGSYIKVGSITQSERLAKYNRLLEIEHFENYPVISE